MTIIGKVLKANTRAFVFGTRVPKQDVPIFGSLVKTRIQYKSATVYGLIYNIEVLDDGMTKMLSVADDIRPEDIEWQRNRRVPVEASVLCVGFQETGQKVRYALPAQPPISLDEVVLCEAGEVRAFTDRCDYFQLVVESRDVPCDELLAASIRYAADLCDDRNGFMRGCGRELARLMANDAARLDALLRRLA
jgi:hypothetical protein